MALKEVGIAEAVLQIAIPMHGRFIHNQDGTTAFQPYGKQGQYINSVSPGELNCRLMDLAEEHGVQILFNHKLTTVDFKNKTAVLKITTKYRNNKGYELLFGADGAYSSARLAHMTHSTTSSNTINTISIATIKNCLFRQEKMESFCSIKMHSTSGHAKIICSLPCPI